MESTQEVRQDLIALLRAYAAVCNRYDVDAAVAMFTPDAVIEFGRQQYTGLEAIRAGHEYDLGSRNQIAFTDCTPDGNVVRCIFTGTDESDRIAGTTGPRQPAEFTFEGGRIRKFQILPAAEAEQQRYRQAKAPFFAWAREHYPDEVAKGFAFTFESGDSLRRVAEAWRDSRQVETKAPPQPEIGSE